jgi:outer membrane protein TolC
MTVFWKSAGASRQIAVAVIAMAVINGGMSVTWSEDRVEIHSVRSDASLEKYLHEALRANPQLAAEYQRVTAEQKMAPQVAALADPKLSYTEFVSQVQTRTGPQERSLALTQAFPWPGKLSLRRGIADSEAEAAFYRYEGLQRQVIREVGSAYYDYAYLAEARRITQENAALLEQLAPIVDEKIRGGGDLGASLRLEVELNRVKDRLQAIDEQRKAQSSRLESFLGRSPSLDNTLPWPRLPASLPPLASQASMEAAVDDHPLITAAKTGVISAKIAQDLAGKASLPDLNVGANLIDIGDGGDTAVGVTVGISLPLNFAKYRAEREESEAKTAAAEADVESLRQRLKADLHRSIQGYREAAKRRELYRGKLLPSAEQALQLTEESYRSDKASITDLIDAERTLLDLRLVNQRALAAAHKSALEIRTLTERLATDQK